MATFLWIMFLLCLLGFFASFLSISRAADHAAAILGLMIFGSCLVVYYVVT